MADELQYTALKKAMEKYGEEVITELAVQLRAADKIATGSLIKSLDYDLIEALDTIVLNIKAADYLSVVDKGRKKQKTPPPQKAILKWINVKPLPKWKDKKGRPISKNSQAFLIARSIGRNGIKATNVIKKSMNKVRKIQAKLIAEAAQEDIRRLVQNVLVNAR
jgi:hypothetical protein